MAERPKSDTRYYRNAKIFTGLGEDSYATAFAVRDGAIAWVGHADDVPAGTSAHDLGAPVVLPGLIDAHTHPSYMAMTLEAVACTPPDVRSIAELVDALRRHGERASGWIRGWGYDESALAEGHTPSRHDLDRVSTERPVHVLRSDFHSGVCNTRALELAAIRAETPDPAGGRFGRDSDGTPNGVLVEFANRAVMQAMGSDRLGDEVDRLVRTSKRLSAHGIVACTDMLCDPGEHSPLDRYRAAQRAGFRQRVRLFYDFTAIVGEPIPPITDDDRSGRAAVGGIKIFVDGSISNRTAWVRKPYRDGGTGLRTAPETVMVDALRFARDNGVQLAVHAMGDAAIEAVLDVYEDVEPWLNDAPSVRIEHGTIFDEDLLARIAAARMTFGVASNVDFLFAEHAAYATNLTPEQFGRCYPVKDLYEAAEALALTSDCPATTWPDPENPFISIYAAVARRAHNGADIVQSQAITVAQAVLLYTGRAATITPIPGVGVLAPGYAANFVTLSDDIFTIEPEAILDVTVTATWIDGEPV